MAIAVSSSAEPRSLRTPAELIGRLVGSGRATAAAGRVLRRGRVEWETVAGSLRPAGAPATAATRFDLASLTKPFVATLALVLARTGELPLATTLGALHPAARGRASRATLESLLRHRSGLQAWAPLEALCRRPAEVTARLLALDLWTSRGPVYSDLGYILWARSAEAVLGAPLDVLLRERVLTPLGLERVRWRPGPGDDVAASGLSREREQALAATLGLALRRPVGPPADGTVQDGNARFLGAPAGHAGLFADAASVAALAEEWRQPGALLGRRAVAEALAGPAGEYALGWARRRVRGTAGPALPASAYGHAGFTGTSVWVDPVAGRTLVLLAHRATSADLGPWRRAFHTLAAGTPKARHR